jgi:hypothetical protein
MAYTSCRYGPPPDPDMPWMTQQIICTDENGTEWTVPGEDCQVGDWLRFVEDGGTVDPYEPPPETKPAPEEAT